MSLQIVLADCTGPGPRQAAAPYLRHMDLRGCSLWIDDLGFMRSRPAVAPSRTGSFATRIEDLTMTYICIEMIDRDTGNHLWFCKNVPGWRLPCGAILKAFWCSFVARRRFPFERYDIIPHITRHPVQ